MQFHIFDSSDFLSHICLLQKKWGIYISITFEESHDYDLPSEILKACPFLTKDQVWSLMFHDDCAFLLFDTEEEMNDTFSYIVGEDGPTRKNSYNEGKVKVHALTCNPQGELLGENS